MHNFLCQNVRIFPNYILLLARKINTFWSGGISSIRNKSLYALNCFKFFLIYILGQNVSKNQTRKILNYIKSLCGKLF